MGYSRRESNVKQVLRIIFDQSNGELSAIIGLVMADKLIKAIKLLKKFGGSLRQAKKIVEHLAALDYDNDDADFSEEGVLSTIAEALSDDEIIAHAMEVLLFYIDGVYVTPCKFSNDKDKLLKFIADHGKLR